MNGEHQTRSQGETEKKGFWKLGLFLGVLTFDLISSIFLLSPFFRRVRHAEGETSHYTLYGSLVDLSILVALRVILSLFGLLVSYIKADVPPEYPFDLHHPNGHRKSREELEQEALEEAFWPWFKRYTSRPTFAGELLCLVAQGLCVVKSLARLNIEIGVLYDAEPFHPLFWLSILLTAVLSVIEASYLDSMCTLVAQYGKDHQGEPPAFLRTISSTLSVPLLAEQNGEPDRQDEEQGSSVDDDINRVGESDIGADANYKVYIPRYLGNILDSLAATFNDADDDASHKESMFEVPGFMKNIKLLVVASVLAGVFSGLRGSIFTIVGGRVNVRLRVQLMDALLSQDIGFFDVTKIGDITSRLSSDTTLVGDQVSLNVNIFLRSLVQALGVLLFMFLVSWQLSILAFISVPLITLLSKWYGNYVRSLTKLMQKKLADGNSVAEASLGAMSTVRSFDAAESELSEIEDHMSKYLKLNYRSAVAYCGYAAFVTAVPELVFAIVVFYGGMLVRNGDMTSGQLVSFLLYLQSLSDAFSSIGWVFSSLTQAVGAADKVFELMNRKPKYREQSDTTNTNQASSHSGILGIEAKKTRMQRTRGICLANPRGEIEFENVDLYYPARPKRRVLNGLSMKIEPGSIVALVGQSGGGKSSVMSLIQHLYECSGGRVLFDGVDVYKLCPEWLSRHISIVSQEPTLFGRSIRRNIMYGLEGTDMEPSQDDIEQAARLANAHDFIMKMPQKYDTEVGERGVQLSGGQKQRIAIARALVRKPRVLLLDEATSALDAESEHLVQLAIDDMLARGRNGDGGPMTVLIVAHRLSTVRNADKIFVIQEGRVVEEGDHNSLVMKEDGFYSALIRRQMETQSKLENAGTAPSS